MMYAIVFHFLAMYPDMPQIVIMGPVPAQYCAEVLRIGDETMGLPPGYRSQSRCADQRQADLLAAAYGCKVLQQAPMRIAKLPNAITYVYQCVGPRPMQDLSAPRDYME